MNVDQFSQSGIPHMQDPGRKFVVAIGEAMIAFRVGAEGVFFAGPGGDSSILLSAAARQGVGTRYISCGAPDRIGQQLLALWAKEGVDSRAETVDPQAPTGICFSYGAGADGTRQHEYRIGGFEHYVYGDRRKGLGHRRIASYLENFSMHQHTRQLNRIARGCRGTLLAQLLAGQPLRVAVVNANSAAAASVTRPGAVDSYPYALVAASGDSE